MLTNEFSQDEIRAIRRGLGKTQQEFADMLGLSKRTIEDWEGGRRKPSGSAKTLLRQMADRLKGAKEE